MVIRNQDIPVKHKKIDDIEGQLQRARLAGIKAKEQLQILYRKALKEVGKVNASIFEVHQMILEDILDSVFNMIREEAVDA